MTINDLSFAARGAIFKVYSTLGPGLLESIYEVALEHELRSHGFKVRRQVQLPVIYEGVTLESGYRIDMIVNDILLIEIKSIEEIHPVHHKQVLTYLRLSNLPLGLLVNFNTDDIKNSIYRKIIDQKAKL
jgi:GxxExxY protein